jgi:hypothetical protein
MNLREKVARIVAPTEWVEVDRARSTHPLLPAVVEQAVQQHARRSLKKADEIIQVIEELRDRP